MLETVFTTMDKMSFSAFVGDIIETKLKEVNGDAKVELPDLATRKDVAKYLGTSTQTVLNLIASGQLKGFRIGNEWRIKWADVASYIDAANSKSKR